MPFALLRTILNNEAKQRMVSASTIVQQIESAVGGRYSDWQIGVTDDAVAGKAKMGNPITWLQWQVKSDQDAQKVFNEFLQKGMKKAGSVKSAKFVYILLGDNPRRNHTDFLMSFGPIF